MTEYADLELCKELYELSGWDDTGLHYGQSTINSDGVQLTAYRSQQELEDDEDIEGFPGIWSYLDIEIGEYEWTVPAYTCGYVLDKLPKHLEHDSLIMDFGYMKGEDAVRFAYGKRDKYMQVGEPKYEGIDDKKPANALVKLAIELFKQEILTRGDEL